MKKIIEWLIKKFLPGYSLHRNPAKGRKNKPKEQQTETVQPFYDTAYTQPGVLDKYGEMSND